MPVASRCSECGSILALHIVAALGQPKRAPVCRKSLIPCLLFGHKRLACRQLPRAASCAKNETLLQVLVERTFAAERLVEGILSELKNCESFEGRDFCRRRRPRGARDALYCVFRGGLQGDLLRRWSCPFGGRANPLPGLRFVGREYSGQIGARYSQRTSW